MAGLAAPDTTPEQHRSFYRPATDLHLHPLPLPPLHPHPHPPHHDSPPRRALPSGPCNYHNDAGRPCGCDQFWDKGSAELHDGSAHHACFHLSAARHPAPEANGLGRMLQSRSTPSQTSTTGLPALPSMCMLSHDRRPAADDGAGLGLATVNRQTMQSLGRQQSASPTIADDSSMAMDPARLFTDLRAPLEQINDFNRNRELLLNVPGDTIPNTLDPHAFVQSLTEAATPSSRGTPDLCAADSAVQQGKKLIDTLSRLTSTVPGQMPTVTSRSPTAPQEEQLQNMLTSASPQDLPKLISYLGPLHNLLISMPNVAKTLRDVERRLDIIENGSFNYVQPEDFQQTLGMYDDRLVTLEHRMDEHELMHQALDADDSSLSFRRHIDNAAESSNSSQSLRSTTPSALVLAAMDRKNKEAELGDIKDRLEVLESTALPTILNPWEVEVVLLPWGRELRGIWFSPDQPMHDSSKTTTQESEEWTQARTPKPTQSFQNLRETDSSPNLGAFSDTESGWSSQAISDWASGSTDDWLHPKACGANNLVYKRLLSRGFVRTVTLQSASARDIQATLAHAFSDVMDWLQFTDRDEDQMVAAHPALRASFIPLRKVMKESKLHFLTPSEMSSSALWSAQFLAAGVVMRVSGGKRRLYVTQREAYVQRSDEMGSSWTWQELRQLPRFQPEQDAQMGGDEHGQSVPEADAKEACWQFAPSYDAPPISIHSSFSSHQSVELSMRPAGRQWRRSITPSSILKNRQLQPLSPLSMFHQQRPRSLTRTASASVLDLPGSAKRRLSAAPTKHASSQPPHSRAPSTSAARAKRRRVTGSSSPQEEEAALEEAQITIWNPTPRRSREPPSPHFTHPALPRSSSDVTSRPSQRSVTRKSNPGAFAYATPASGPFVGSAYGGYNQGGDTEPDDDDENVKGEDTDEDNESVNGEDSDDDDSASTSSSAEAGAQEMVSFSADENGIKYEHDSEGETTPTIPRRRLDEDEDEDEDGGEDDGEDNDKDDDEDEEDEEDDKEDNEEANNKEANNINPRRSDSVEIFDTMLEILEPCCDDCTLYDCDSS